MAKQKGNLSDIVTKILAKHSAELVEATPMVFGHYAPVGKRTRAERKLAALNNLDVAKRNLKLKMQEIARAG